jgi:hypothetical protein
MCHYLKNTKGYFIFSCGETNIDLMDGNVDMAGTSGQADVVEKRTERDDAREVDLNNGLRDEIGIEPIVEDAALPIKSVSEIGEDVGRGKTWKSRLK